MRGTRLRTRGLGALLRVVWGVLWGSVSIACSATGIGHGPSLSISPPPPGNSSPSETVSPSSSVSPGPESPLEVGVASLTLSGDVAMSVSFSSIVTPAVWAPPPAPMDITWTSGQNELNLSGTSFVSLADTSANAVLSFTVNRPEGPVEFSSAAGECSVTITPAFPDQMGGVFTCLLLTDVEGTLTVDARGSFSASG
jgi:hypothetical protein